MSGRFEGKAVVVTGAGQGIGRATAECFAGDAAPTPPAQPVQPPQAAQPMQPMQSMPPAQSYYAAQSVYGAPAYPQQPPPYGAPVYPAQPIPADPAVAAPVAPHPETVAKDVPAADPRVD